MIIVPPLTAIEIQVVADYTEKRPNKEKTIESPPECNDDNEIMRALECMYYIQENIKE